MFVISYHPSQYLGPGHCDLPTVWNTRIFLFSVYNKINHTAQMQHCYINPCTKTCILRTSYGWVRILRGIVYGLENRLTEIRGALAHSAPRPEVNTLKVGNVFSFFSCSSLFFWRVVGRGYVDSQFILTVLVSSQSRDLLPLSVLALGYLLSDIESRSIY